MSDQLNELWFCLVVKDGKNVEGHISGPLHALSHMLFDAMNGNNDIANVVTNAFAAFTAQERFKQS